MPTLVPIVQELSSSQNPQKAVELVRTLDRNAVFGVIITPPIASLVFVIVWLSIYLRKTDENEGKIDVQVIVTTAFTLASYLATTGALVIALVAYLDGTQPARDNPGFRRETEFRPQYINLRPRRQTR